MTNMKLFARRVALIHASVVFFALACVSVLNYLVWTYQPDTRLETLETLLWPFFRLVLTLYSLTVLVTIAISPHTLRVLKKLSYFNK